MPRKLRRGCSCAMCPELALLGGQRCEKHEQEAAALRFKQNQQRQSTDSRAAYKAFYHSTGWRKTRAYWLNQEPLCRSCQRPAEMVDHIVPIHEGGDPWDLNNLQSLCNSCHARKRGKEGAIASRKRELL